MYVCHYRDPRCCLVLKLWHNAHTRCQCSMVATSLRLARFVNNDVVIQENSDLMLDCFAETPIIRALKNPSEWKCLVNGTTAMMEQHET